VEGRQARGYALLIIMMMVTLLLVSLTAALPSVYQEGQREREEELIFRGQQYARAIYLFHRQFQRYPVNIKELLETNGMRFLRREYRDPMDPKGKWRFIHANAAGVLLDSKVSPLRPGAGTGLPGSSSQIQGSSSSLRGGSSFMSGTSMFQSSSPSMMGATSQTQSGFASSSASSTGGMETATTGQQGERSSFFGSGNQVQGAFIVGVAATSKKQSIRVWNKRTHYDEWEFLGVDLSSLGLPAGVPGLQAAPPQQTGFGSTQPRTTMQPAGTFMQQPSSSTPTFPSSPQQ
jgi:type II secretory pathway pseudopilin PulG